jgi:hypothetical protein
VVLNSQRNLEQPIVGQRTRNSGLPTTLDALMVPLAPTNSTYQPFTTTFSLTGTSILGSIEAKHFADFPEFEELISFVCTYQMIRTIM